MADVKKCNALAPGLDHAKCEAALCPFGIDYTAMLSEITAALIADGKKAVEDVLGVVQSYLGGAPCCQSKRATPPGTWLALLQQFASALAADAPTILPIILQVIAALVTKTPVAA